MVFYFWTPFGSHIFKRGRGNHRKANEKHISLEKISKTLVFDFTNFFGISGQFIVINFTKMSSKNYVSICTIFIELVF